MGQSWLIIHNFNRLDNTEARTEMSLSRQHSKYQTIETICIMTLIGSSPHGNKYKNVVSPYMGISYCPPEHF